MKRILLCAIVLIAISLIAPGASAGACCYGSVHAWYQGSNGQWVNATAHPVLKPGEVFRLQIRVKLSTVCQVFFLKLHEFGTPVYEVLSGPTQIEELLEYRQKIRVQYPYIFDWTVCVRPTTSWTCGSAPLELFAQLNKDNSKECTVDFDVLVATILPRNQTDSVPHQVKDNRSSDAHSGWSLPGFQADFAFMAIVVLWLSLNKTQPRQRKK